MNRCTARLVAFLMTLLAASVLAAAPAAAQTAEAGREPRAFPTAALRGEMEVVAPPQILLDGKPDRLSPGARIRDVNNLFVLSGPLLNRKLVVNYLRDGSGQVQQVWILSPEEARQKRAGASDTRFNFSFGTPAAPVDDGKTPYHLLPGYKP